MKWLVFFGSILVGFFLGSLPFVEAATTGTVATTVRVSVCGNQVKEGGEDCDNANLGGKTCTSLGYAGGTLQCDQSCSFETSACIVPQMNPHTISYQDVPSILASGYFGIPQTASILTPPSLTAMQQLTLTLPVTDGTHRVILPKDVIITRSDGNNLDPTALALAPVMTTTLSGFSSHAIIDGALKWGIPDGTLVFTHPVNLQIHVGTALDGEVLGVVRSESAISGWTSDGIVAPATCTVTAGICTFQATKASYFAATRTSSSSSTSSSTGSSSSPLLSQTSISTSTPTPVIVPSRTVTKKITALPFIIGLFDLDKNGRIKLTEVSAVIKKWMDAQHTEQELCDINHDGTCGVQDISILLFYVDK